MTDAFWLNPDWAGGDNIRSGATPFWMRPPKKAIERPCPACGEETGRMPWTGHWACMVCEWEEGMQTHAAGSVFDYMLTDEEWDRRYRL